MVSALGMNTFSTKFGNRNVTMMSRRIGLAAAE
jgi:hypothetical protein